MYKGYLFFSAPDAHLLSLNAKDGSVAESRSCGCHKRLLDSMAPLIVGTVLVGVSGDFDNLSGISARSILETGATQWQWNSTPPPQEPEPNDGWNDGG